MKHSFESRTNLSFVEFILILCLLFIAVSCEQPSGAGTNTPVTPPAGPTEPPAAPQNVAVSSADGSVAVVWDRVADADSYQVWYTQTPGGSITSSMAWPGSVTIGFTQGSAVISGLTNDAPCYVWVRAQNAAGVSPYSVIASATPESSYTMPKLFFDYGKALSSTVITGGAYPAGTYTAPAGRPLVLAPIEWRLDSDSYEWTVDDAVQAATGKTFSFTLAAPGTTHVITVKAKKSGEHIVGAQAQTFVVGTASEASHKRSKTESSGVKASEIIDFTQAPGQFVGINRFSVPITLTDTQAEVNALAQTRAEESSAEWIYSLGRFGGSVICKFDHSVENAAGPDIAICGNAFGGWSEPGTFWVSQDDNGNGLSDDTWYELKGSLTGTAGAIQRYAVTYTRPNSPVIDLTTSIAVGNASIWKDNLGNSGVFTGHYPWQASGDLTFVGTLLIAPENDNNLSGYVDTLNTGKFDISDAIQSDGTLISLDYILYGFNT
jgi:hypothetical protein